MNSLTFYDALCRAFSHPLTSDQQVAAQRLSAFVFTEATRPTFVLRGYAGTGKTTLIGAFVHALKQANAGVVLLAPTGRAAKVLAAHAHHEAYTIHKAIYRQRTFSGEHTRFDLGFNAQQSTIFIVDEASMISRSGGFDNPFGSGRVLDDLIDFVFSRRNCRLLLVGDNAQLPPVGETESPALHADTLRTYGLNVAEANLTEVVRQHAASSVLTAATQIRQQLMRGELTRPTLTVSRRGEVRYLPGDELIEQLISDYADYGEEETIIVTRANKRAGLYNAGIRQRIFDREADLTRGDRVMVVKNNYYWTTQLAKKLPPNTSLPLDFVANGDSATVLRLSNIHEMHGFMFADATLRFADYNDFELDCRVLLSTLQSESPSLTTMEAEKLMNSVLADYADIPSKTERMKKVREDAYYNALQLKYAYAVTCHKAQGGQWARVYIDQGYIPDDADGRDYLRWLYTAITRTTQQVYLVNWPESLRREEE